MLPSQWDVSTVKEFLMRSLRNTTHTMRTVKIEHNLAKGENLQVERKWKRERGETERRKEGED